MIVEYLVLPEIHREIALKIEYELLQGDLMKQYK